MIELKTADTDREFEQIHRLNYQTFVQEIPQHKPNAEELLVDKFHSSNQYIIAKENDLLLGMLAYNKQRPFSLDQKLDHLDHSLPPFEKPVEVRLLSILAERRRSTVFFLLIKKLAEQLRGGDFDIALISGTTRQLDLYHKIGFVDFATLVGNGEALYQPMYLTQHTLQLNYLRQWLNSSTSPQGL